MKDSVRLLSLLLVIVILFTGCTQPVEKPVVELPPEVEIEIPKIEVGLPMGIEEVALKEQVNQLVKSKSGYYSVGIKDTTTGNTVYINDTQLKSASIIKVFVAYAVYQLASEGKLDINKELTLTNEVKCGGTGILQGQKTGSKYTIDYLVELMLSISDNTASNMLLHEISIEYVNECIQTLGCKDTVLGWYFVIPGPAGVRNLTSVRDLNLFFEKVYTNTLLGEEYDQKMIEYLKKNKNNSKLVALLPKGTVVAHKTGAISQHEHDGGIIYGPTSDIIITVLAKDGSQKVISEIAKVAYDFYN